SETTPDPRRSAAGGTFRREIRREAGMSLRLRGRARTTWPEGPSSGGDLRALAGHGLFAALALCGGPAVAGSGRLQLEPEGIGNRLFKQPFQLLLAHDVRPSSGREECPVGGRNATDARRVAGIRRDGAGSGVAFVFEDRRELQDFVLA